MHSNQRHLPSKYVSARYKNNASTVLCLPVPPGLIMFYQKVLEHISSTEQCKTWKSSWSSTYMKKERENDSFPERICWLRVGYEKQVTHWSLVLQKCTSYVFVQKLINFLLWTYVFTVPSCFRSQNWYENRFVKLYLPVDWKVTAFSWWLLGLE